MNSTTRRPFFTRMLHVLRVVAVNFLIFAVLAELVSLILVHRGTWPSSRPNYHLTYNHFFADSNPVFGVWHRPNSVFFHKGGCYDVVYRTNSYGARDAERSLYSSQPRTIVLGDSMIEGLGLPAEERLSNLLEKATGRPHLNFGTSGDFGPLQYALLYKSLAAPFDHNVVIVGVLPINDFHDMSYAFWSAHGLGSRYRPYYAPDLSVFYAGHFDPNAGEGTADHVEAFLRAYLASYHVGQFIYTRFYWRMRPSYSGYNDFDDVDLARLKKSLLDIQSTAEAHGARERVFLIPSAIDFIRLRTSGEDKLGPVLQAWGKEAGIPVKDLLPDMNALAGADYRSYFLPCDGHWSAKGNAVAARILLPWLNYPGDSGAGP